MHYENLLRVKKGIRVFNDKAQETANQNELIWLVNTFISYISRARHDKKRADNALNGILHYYKDMKVDKRALSEVVNKEYKKLLGPKKKPTKSQIADYKDCLKSLHKSGHSYQKIADILWKNYGIQTSKSSVARLLKR